MADDFAAHVTGKALPGQGLLTAPRVMVSTDDLDRVVQLGISFTEGHVSVFLTVESARLLAKHLADADTHLADLPTVRATS